MPSDFQVNEDSYSKAERRFLLFQVDLGNRDLNTVLGARGLTDTRQPQDVVRISDPVDYDDPASPIYWRKIPNLRDTQGNNVYVQELKNQFSLFLSQFQTAISDGSIKLKSTGGPAGDRPYVDMSDFVKESDGYSVRVDELSNSLRLVLARPQSTDMVSGDKDAEGEISVNFNDDVFGALNPNENDIIVVKSAYSPDENYDPEYIGVVTKVQKTFINGSVDSFQIEVSGLSKIFYTTQMIKNKSARPGEFVPGIELNDKAKNTPYSSNFDKKNVREVFRYILEDSLSCKEIDQKTHQFLYRLDPSIFVSFEKFGFQHNIFVLLALYLMSVTEAPTPTDEDDSVTARLFPQSEPNTNDDLVLGFNSDAFFAANNAKPNPVEPRTASRPLLDFFLRAVLERGSHRAYNRMARQGVERFFSEMTAPAGILGEVRSNSYTDIFESRDGVVVCRPPRYNKIEETLSETQRFSAEDDFSFIFKLSPEKIWEFNPDADFVIKPEDLKSINAVSKDEMSLESRIDVKAIFPMRGEVDYPTALYVDPDILFRYGLRTHGAVSNPNAYNRRLARIFAPIALAMVNAPTRTLEITVKDNRKYYVGKLYYIKAIDMVAYLVQDTINHRNGGLSTRTLSFSMLRQVIRRPINDIKRVPEEVLNVGMMFTSDFPDQDGIERLVSEGLFLQSPDVASGPVKPNPKNLMYTKGLALLDKLLSETTDEPVQSSSEFQAGSHRDFRGSENGQQSAASTKIVMFKYLPNIEDLVMEVESNPKLVEPPNEKDNSVKDAQTQAKDVRIKGFVKDGYLYVTAGDPSFVPPTFEYQAYSPSITAINNDAANNRREAFALGDATLIQYQRSQVAPESIAGMLGYLFPAPLQEQSAFVQVVGETKRPVVYRRTPFLASALSNPAQNIVISQVLVNMLASLDLFMKFRPANAGLAALEATFGISPGLGVRMDKNRIPQLYYLAGDEFLLYGSRLKPSEYISSLLNNYGIEKRGLLPVLDFQEDILEYPTVLKLNKDRNAFENDRYSIPARNGVFDLPFGHLVLKQRNKSFFAAVTGNTDPNLLSYYKVQSTVNKTWGGKVAFAKSSLGSWLFSPQNSETTVTDENTGEVVGFGDHLDRSSPDPNDLYFISPFLEPTIERLLDVNLPVEYGGNLTAAQADQQKKLSNKGALTSQLLRKDGRGINVSPDYLFVASKSNIVPKDGIYRRFEALVFKNGIFDRAHASRVPNAATANLVLPSGEDLGPRSMMFYTLFVTEADESKYSSKIQVSDSTVLVPQAT